MAAAAPGTTAGPAGGQVLPGQVVTLSGTDISGALPAIQQALASGDLAEIARIKSEIRQQTPPEGADPAERLQKLAELHTRGVLTDDEFAAAKAKLLNEI
jgi:Short C-terminal domain